MPYFRYCEDSNNTPIIACPPFLNYTQDAKSYPASMYLFKVNNRNTRKMCEICAKLTMKTPERLQNCRSGVFIVNFEHISHLFLLFLFLTLNKYMLAGKVDAISIFNLVFDVPFDIPYA